MAFRRPPPSPWPPPSSAPTCSASLRPWCTRGTRRWWRSTAGSGVQFNRHFEFWAQYWASRGPTSRFWENFSTLVLGHYQFRHVSKLQTWLWSGSRLDFRTKYVYWIAPLVGRAYHEGPGNVAHSPQRRRWNGTCPGISGLDLRLSYPSCNVRRLRPA